MFEINTSNFPKCKFLCKNRNSQVWNQRCLILVFLDWNLKKTIAKIWNQHPQTCQHAKICRKNNLQIWNQKGLAWVSFNFLINFFINFESHCYISNHHTRNCQNTKFRPTIFFFWTRDQRCLIWVFLGCNFEKLLSHLKSEPSTLSKSKMCANKKASNFGPNMTYLDQEYLIFGMLFWKTIVMFEISTP